MKNKCLLFFACLVVSLLLLSCTAKKNKTVSFDLTTLKKEIKAQEIPKLDHDTTPHYTDFDKIQNYIAGSLMLNDSSPIDTISILSKSKQAKILSLVIQSSQYFKIYKKTASTLIIDIPPEGIPFQIIVVAVTTPVKYIDDLSKDNILNYSIYYGIQENNFDLKENDHLEITLKRNCFATETPSGCAVFSDNRNALPVITPPVTITGIQFDKKPFEFSGDNLLRCKTLKRVNTSTPINEQKFPLTITTLKDIPDTQMLLHDILTNCAPEDTHSANIRSVHPSNPLETDACKQGDLTKCEVKNSLIVFQ